MSLSSAEVHHFTRETLETKETLTRVPEFHSDPPSVRSIQAGQLALGSYFSDLDLRYKISSQSQLPGLEYFFKRRARSDPIGHKTASHFSCLGIPGEPKRESTRVLSPPSVGPSIPSRVRQKCSSQKRPQNFPQTPFHSHNRRSPSNSALKNVYVFPLLIRLLSTQGSQGHSPQGTAFKPSLKTPRDARNSQFIPSRWHLP